MNTFTVPGRIYQKDLEEEYNRIVYWRKNVFMVPTGAAGKNMFHEISRLLNLSTRNTPLKNIVLKAVHVKPALLLQKPGKTLKTKDHLKALEKRLRFWKEQNITELVNESKTIQDRLPSTKKNQMNIEKPSSKFKQPMQKRNIFLCLNLATSRGTTSLPRSDITRARKTTTQHCL